MRVKENVQSAHFTYRPVYFHKEDSNFTVSSYNKKSILNTNNWVKYQKKDSWHLGVDLISFLFVQFNSQLVVSKMFTFASYSDLSFTALLLQFLT